MMFITKLLRPQVKVYKCWRLQCNNHLNIFRNNGLGMKPFSTAGDFKSSIFIDMEDNTIDIDSDNKTYQ